MRKRLNTPAVVIGVLLVAFVVAGIAAGRHRAATADSPAAVAKQVDTIARRVEILRQLRFKHIPKPEIQTPEQTQAAALREVDRTYPASQRRADEQLLELLGLVPPGTDLRKLEGDISGGEVAGYYDTRSKKLVVVSGPASSGVLAEITLSHELTHALEDQRFGLHDNPSAGADDRASAYTALVEGTATQVMDDYTQRFVPPSAALSSALAALGAGGGSTAQIPPYIQRSLEFSYTGGERFVAALYSVANGWKLVNFALHGHPPVSTEQVMHPEKYLTREAPLPVRLPDARTQLGAGWKRSRAGTLGEFDTRELLRLGNATGAATDAAAGWGGGRYALWTKGAEGALFLRWAWDTPADARQFDAALRGYVTKGLHGTPNGACWSVPGGVVTISETRSETTLARVPSGSAAC